MTEQTPAPGAVRVDVEGAVGRIVLDDPARLNALSTQMLEDLAAAVERLDADPQVRVIVLTGEGRGFCSGADLGSADTSTLEGAARAVRALRACSTTTLASINGVAAGVGVSLALVCRYTLASDAAAFMLAFTKVGLMPDGGATALVAANIGRARAQRMALTAEKVPATTAGEWGLVAEVVPAADLAARTAELAGQFATGAPGGLAETGQAVDAATLVELDAALEREIAGQTRLLASEDFAEGVAAFQEKRPAVFTGR